MNNIQIILALFLSSALSWVTGFMFNGMVIRDKCVSGASVFPIIITVIIGCSLVVMFLGIITGGIQ